MRLFENINIDFMGKRSLFFVISSILILLGLLNILIRGLSFGIDFNGGTEIALQFEKPIDIAFIRDEVEKIGLGEIEVKTFGSSTGVLIRTELQELPAAILPQVKSHIESAIFNTLPGISKSITDSSSSSVTYEFQDYKSAEIVSNRLYAIGFQTSKATEDSTNRSVNVRLGIADWVKDNLRETFKENPFTVLKEDKVGPKVGNELKKDAVIAIIISLIAILVYISFRFKFTFAVGAVIALFHDILLTLGLFAMFYGVIPGLNLDVNLTTVAAFLTLIGYSINDTVVVFDRVREQLKIHKSSISLEKNINLAINKTFSRTIITGLATIMSIVVLLILGGEVLSGFAFVLLIGMLAGTYSSVFVASAFVLEVANRTKQKIEF